MGLPAIQAVIKQATLPASMALKTTLVTSAFLEGAMAPSAPIIIPMEPRLEKPHRAYVAMTVDRFCIL